MSALRRFVDLCRNYRRLLLGAVVVVTAVASFGACQLSIDSNLQRLLPPTATSVQSLQRLERTYASSLGRLTVLLEGDDLSAMKQAAAELADRLRDLEGVDRVEYRRPRAFFSRYRLLYADYADLQTVEERFDTRIRWEKQRANPLFVGVDDEPPAIDLSDITTKYEEADGSAYYVNDKKNRLALFIFPTFPAKQLGPAKRLVRRVDRRVSAYLDGSAPAIDFALTGRYKKRVDLQSLLTSDLTTATTVAVVALLVFLLLMLRSGVGLALVLLPLMTATTWTFAWAELAFDSLNLLTGFLGAILLGLGVDYGIHLHFRYYEIQRREAPTEAVVQTLASAGRSNLFAGLTTMVPMASLITSEFQAFYEFGVIAVGGVAFILLAYCLLFPCLIFVLANWNIVPREPLSGVVIKRLAPWVREREQQHSGLMRRVWRSAAIAMAVLALPALVGATQVEFNRSFYILQSTQAQSWKLDQVVNEILGRSQTPAVILTKSSQHTRRVVEELHRRARDAPGGYTIDQVVSLQTLLPNQQSKKLDLLRRLDQKLQELPDDAAQDDKLTSYIEELDRVLAKAPLDVGELPDRLTAPLQRKGGDTHSLVLVFPAGNLTDIETVQDFVGVLQDLPGIEYEHGYDAMSEALLLYDILQYVERDATRMLALTLIGLALMSLFAFWRFWDSALQFGVLLASLGVAIGWIGLVGVQFNFLNIIVLPIWLGLGIDATFHMLFNLRDNPKSLAGHLTTALAIAAAFLTTMIGFGVTLLAHHDGLYSLGAIAVWGLGLLLVCHLLGYAYLLGRSRSRTDRTVDSDGNGS
ncbi:MAG: RND family transporter [Bradymonadaceae bacterium]